MLIKSTFFLWVVQREWARADMCVFKASLLISHIERICEDYRFPLVSYWIVADAVWTVGSLCSRAVSIIWSEHTELNIQFHMVIKNKCQFYRIITNKRAEKSQTWKSLKKRSSNMSFLLFYSVIIYYITTYPHQPLY